MKTFCILLFALSIFCFFLSFELNAQWVQCEPPILDISSNEYDISGIVSIGKTLLIGIYDFRDIKLLYDTPLEARGGIYISTDDGITWKNSSNGLPKISNVSKLFQCAGNIYVATDGGIYLSSDGGQNWSPARKGLPILSLIGDFICRGDTLVVIVKEKISENNSIYRSTNKGMEWKLLSNMELYSFCELKEKYIGGSNGGHLYQSFDFCVNWKGIYPRAIDRTIWEDGKKYSTRDVFSGNIIQLLPTTADNGFFAVTSRSIYHIVNGGETFEKTATGLPQKGERISNLFSINDSVYVVYSSRFSFNEKCGLYLTLDYGKNWIYAANDGLPLDDSLSKDVNQITNILCANNKIYVVSYRKGVLKRQLSEFLNTINK